MSTDRETTRIVRSWLEDGVTRLPDNVLDAVLDDLPSTHQRRATWWPAWRLYQMNSTSKLALGAVAAVVVAIIGFTFVSTGNIGGPPVGTEAPSAAPSIEARALPAGGSTLQAGSYRVSNPVYVPATVEFTVPEGWIANDPGAIAKNTNDTSEVGLGFGTVTHVYEDACESAGTLTEIGPSPDDLIEALLAIENVTVSGPTDLMIDGHPGQRVDLAYPPDLDTATCRNPGIVIQIWADATEENFFALFTDHIASVYVVDVDGRRLVFTTDHGPDASDEDRAELQEIVGSLRIASEP